MQANFEALFSYNLTNIIKNYHNEIIGRTRFRFSAHITGKCRKRFASNYRNATNHI